MNGDRNEIELPQHSQGRSERSGQICHHTLVLAVSGQDPAMLDPYCTLVQ